MTYTPLRGSVPDRVVSWLRRQPPGTVFSAAAVADIVSVPKASLMAYLRPAIAHQLVVERLDDAGARFYGLAAGHITRPPFGGGVHPVTPPAPVAEADDEPITRRVVPAAATSIPAEALAALAAGLMPPAGPAGESDQSEQATQDDDEQVEQLRAELGEPPSPPAQEPAAPPPVAKAAEEVPVPMPTPAPARHENPVPPEQQRAIEVLDRAGFPVPEGKHPICRGLFLYMRGNRGNGGFVMRYTAPSGRRREMGLGPFIAVSRERAVAAIAAAILQAEEKLAQVLAGVDPLDEKEAGEAVQEIPVFLETPTEPLPAPTPDPRGITIADLDRWRQQLSAMPAPAVRTAVAAQPDSDEPLLCALWSDGRLFIQAQGHKVTLTAKNAKALCKYLANVQGGPAA